MLAAPTASSFNTNCCMTTATAKKKKAKRAADKVESSPRENILGLALPILTVLDNPELLVDNPLNPRNGEKNVDDLMSSFRLHGFEAYEEPATGNVYHMIGFRHPEHPEKVMLLRGHRRAGALKKIFRADMKDTSSLGENEKSFGDIIKHAQRRYDLSEAGIPVMVYEESLDNKQQLTLLLDEDSSQVKKDNRMQLKLFREMVIAGWGPEQACRNLGFNGRYMPFQWATSGQLPEEIVDAWVAGGAGADKRMTDAEFKVLYDAFRDLTAGKIEEPEATEKWNAWKAKGEGDSPTNPVRASQKQLRELLNTVANREQTDMVKAVKYALAYAAGEIGSAGSFNKVERDTQKALLLDILPAPTLEQVQNGAAD
jgi:hypothetical protein